MFYDFAAIRERVKMEEVCEWFGVKLTREQSTSRSTCPICKTEEKRAFVVTHAKQMYFCHKCQKGGDCISLYANIEGIGVKEAAAAILARIDAPKPDAGKKLEALAYLVHEHEKVQAIMPADLARRIGAGYAPKGVLAGRCLIPIRDEAGKLLFYIGYSDTLYPTWKLPKNLG